MDVRRARLDASTTAFINSAAASFAGVVQGQRAKRSHQRCGPALIKLPKRLIKVTHVHVHERATVTRDNVPPDRAAPADRVLRNARPYSPSSRCSIAFTKWTTGSFGACCARFTSSRAFCFSPRHR